MLSFFVGGLVMAGIFNAFAVNEFMGLNPIHQLMLGASCSVWSSWLLIL